MHAAVEEVDLDPCDLYTDLGTLIVEGRVPGQNDKGFGEGPHCFSTTLNGQNRHQCDPTSPECQKYEQILKHMLLLWKNGIPMTIEVLLYPSCCAPLPNSDSVPDMPYILLEQWTIHMLPRRVPDAVITSKGLIHAVRSFLFFSQLSAWYSLTGGKSPQNIHYRVCVPGEAFSSKFSSQPDIHIFPVANTSRNSAMKVLVKCHPRCGEIPTVLCRKHCGPPLPLKALRGHPDLPSTSDVLPYDGIASRTSSPADSMLGESLLDPPPSLCMYPKRYQSPQRCGSPSIEVPEHLMFGKACGGAGSEERSRRSRPQRRPVVERFLKKDLMGDKDVERILKKDIDKDVVGRYMSKELLSDKDVMERLLKKDLIGDKDVLDRILKKDLVRDKDSSELVKEDRVMERILQKDKMGDKNVLSLQELMDIQPGCADQICMVCTLNGCGRVCKKERGGKLKGYGNLCSDRTHLEKPQKELVPDVLALKKDKVLTYCSLDMKHVPKEEMDAVLEKLRHRQVRKFDDATDRDVTQLVTGLKVSPDRTENPVSRKAPPDQSVSKPVLKQPLWLYKDTNSRKSCDKSNKMPEKLSSLPDVQSPKMLKNSTLGPLGEIPSPLLSPQIVKLKGKPSYYNFKRNQSNLLRSPEESPSQHSGVVRLGPLLVNTYQQQSANSKSHQSSSVHPMVSGINIKKCGPLLTSASDELTDERELPGEACTNQNEQIDEICDKRLLEIPSAEEKAIFRRSLDSATSLVFHKRSGLPLTSSPAPSRKWGTSFDYDSSLTTVSAIKRALFEKENEAEPKVLDKNKNAHLSTSAPASIFSSSLLGTFEESVLNGRLEPVSTVEGFTAEIGASGSFCPRHVKLPVTVFFYTLQDMDKVTSPYMGHLNLRGNDYHVPKKGTVQVTLFNPHETVVKMFVVRYDLSDMPVNCQTFLRQRTLHMPADASDGDPDAQKWLRYLIHLRFMSSKSGRIYLHTDIRLIIFRKSDLDAATVHGQRPYELRTFLHGPLNPKYSPHKP